jgi:hypothetical protein
MTMLRKCREQGELRLNYIQQLQHNGSDLQAEEVEKIGL